MENYESRFLLRNGKYAYIQKEELRSAAYPRIERIKKHWTPPEFFFHLRNGGHVAALHIHRGNFYFVKIDLKAFFQHVTKNRLVRVLKKFGFSFAEAREFATESTIRVPGRPPTFALPYGFVQSPILASAALDLSELGGCLRQIGKDMPLSVYVDDIIISSEVDDGALEAAKAKIQVAAERSGFPVSVEKTLGPTEKITAFNVTLAHNFLEITAERFEEMSQHVSKAGESDEANGILGYVTTISPVQADALVKAFPRCFPERD